MTLDRTCTLIVTAVSVIAVIPVMLDLHRRWADKPRPVPARSSTAWPRGVARSGPSWDLPQDVADFLRRVERLPPREGYCAHCRDPHDDMLDSTAQELTGWRLLAMAERGVPDQPARDLPPTLPLHRTEAGYPRCATCDGGGCLDCTDPA